MKIEKSFSGLFEEWTLSNSSNHDLIRIVPAAGGNISFIRLKEKTILSGIENESELGENKSYSSAILFPWGNRINNGRYFFNGVSYQLPINDASSHHAIHGYVCTKPFIVSDTITDEHKCQLRMKLNDNGKYHGYPFPFILDVSVTLYANSLLTIDFLVENTGKTKMPLVLGWHPYFSFDMENVSNWEIRFSALAKYKLNEFNIPISTIKMNHLEEHCILIEDKYLNEAFHLNPSDDRVATVILRSNITGHEIKLLQRGDEKQFDYLVVYTPSHRKSIAIEPMSGCINAFNNNDGLVSLAPGNNVKFSIGVEIIEYSFSNNPKAIRC